MPTILGILDSPPGAVKTDGFDQHLAIKNNLNSPRTEFLVDYYLKSEFFAGDDAMAYRYIQPPHHIIHRLVFYFASLVSGI